MYISVCKMFVGRDMYFVRFRASETLSCSPTFPMSLVSVAAHLVVTNTDATNNHNHRFWMLFASGS